MSDLEARAGEDREAPALPLRAADGSTEAGLFQPRIVAAPGIGDNSTPAVFRRLEQLDARYEDESRTLFTWMQPAGRPSFTPQLLVDFDRWQGAILECFGPGKLPLDFLVLGSRAQGVWCFGGDLHLFQSLIRNGDRAGLAAYGHRCVEILHRNYTALDLPLLTVGLVQGQALGGGLEALLSFDFIIAERGTTFGLPEINFGLFPGMGAHAFLSRRLGVAQAERMILANRSYTAEEFYEMGLITQLANPGEGEKEVRAFIKRSARRHAGLLGARRAMRRSQPLLLDELTDIVDVWAESALHLSETDLRFMSRLVSAQDRKVG